MRRRDLITIAMPLALAACQHAVDATPPPLQGHSFERRQVEYVYQALMFRSERAKWLEMYGNQAARSAPSSGLSATDAGTLAGVASAGAAGASPLSARGVNIAAGVGAGVAAGLTVLSLADSVAMWGPGAWIVSELVITPEEVDANTIVDGKSALTFARQQLGAATNRFARETGRQAECVHNCEGLFPTFELRRSNGRIPAPGQFDPDPLYVTFGIKAVIRHTADDPVLDRILGYRPSMGVVFLPCLSEQKLTFEDGDGQKFAEANPSAFKRLFTGQAVCRNGLQSPLELHFLRTLTANAKVLRGSALDRVVALKGRLYHMDSVMADDFIDYEVLPPRD